MCGFAGFLERTPTLSAEATQALAERMANTLRHRGPDDSGVWVDAAAGFAVGFRRLAILDPSPRGHQPMLSAEKRYVIAFNGEIYNHAELRRELANHADVEFRGHSDTEVLLAAIEIWGVAEMLRRAAGMFAIALWDRMGRTLTLARDRMGEKPLYYGWQEDVFLFGSELKALRQHPRCTGRLHRNVLALYLRQGYIPAPHSIHDGLHKLPPGTFLTVRASDSRLSPEPYWSVRQAAEAGLRQRLNGSPAELADRLEETLRKVIGEQMLADVPLGAFLSGGVDSSTIVALMQVQSRRPVKTYTIGFHERDFNEAEQARAVAQHLGTEHTELYVAPAAALEAIPRLPDLYDEPFADSSQIPTFLVAQMASRHVTVSLSGDGGDEVFAGYLWYGRAEQLWRRLQLIPRPFRNLARTLLLRPSLGTWKHCLDWLTWPLPARWRDRLTADRFHKMGQLLAHADRIENLHQWLISTHWNLPEPVLPEAVAPLSALDDAAAWARLDSLVGRLQCFDMLTYLPDDILVKVDRASMGVSLESRAPFLDHRVVELAWRIPPTWQRHEGVGKWLLRQVLYRHVPRELIERPKQGFMVPLAGWLRGPLRDWAEALLAPDRLQREGIFHEPGIRQLWQEHLTGQRDWSNQLWTVLMFQAWRERWG